MRSESSESVGERRRFMAQAVVVQVVVQEKTRRPQYAQTCGKRIRNFDQHSYHRALGGNHHGDGSAS